MKVQRIFVVCLLSVAVPAAPNQIDWSQVKSLNAPMPMEDGPGGRITNGQIATPGQFPYQVGLLLTVAQGKAWCGASLISDSWVLTVAHCTADTLSADIYLGAWNRTDSTESNQKIITNVTKENFIVHENYDPQTIANDISLIKLPSAVKLNAYIQPIALPKLNGPSFSYVGRFAIASGWGRISDAASTATDVLRWARVPILDNFICNLYFRGQIKSTNICIATVFGSSTCNGDSGGPLVYNDGQNAYLIGATSFGSALGCQLGFPGVFTRIPSYLSWIQAHSGVVNN